MFRYIKRFFGNSGDYKQMNDRVITLYYASWCGYSKNFLPTWYELKNFYANIKFIELDCSIKKNEDLASLNDIPGYPTIIFSDGDKKKEYAGDRTIESFKSEIDLFYSK